nr:hypothetical protein [Halocatena marina]
MSTESWGEFVEFQLVTVMSQYEGYNNAEGDNPQASRKWMGPVGDVVVEVHTDASITGVGHGNWATGAIETIVDKTLSKLVIGQNPTNARDCGTTSCTGQRSRSAGRTRPSRLSVPSISRSGTSPAKRPGNPSTNCSGSR